MKVKYILHLALINLSTRKMRTIISLLLMATALTILIVTLSLSSSMTSYFDRNFANNSGCKTLFISYDYQVYSEEQMIDMVSKYEHIVAVVPQGAFTQVLNLSTLVDKVQLPQGGGNDGLITINGGNKFTDKDIIVGRNFKEGETNVAIIPEKFLPDSRGESLDKNNKGYKFIDGKSLLGKKLTGKTSGNNTYTFTVIGVYDSTKSMDEKSNCYIPYNDVNEIYKSLKVVKSKDTYYPIMAVVDNYKNTSTVMDKLFREGMQPSVSVKFNTKLPRYINLIGGLLSILIFIVALINISLTTINSVKDRTQEIGILKSIGYNNKAVLAMLNLETLILGILGFIVSILFSSGVLLLISKNNTDSTLVIGTNKLCILFAFIVSITVPAIACILAGIKIIKIQPSSAMRE